MEKKLFLFVLACIIGTTCSYSQGFLKYASRGVSRASRNAYLLTKTIQRQNHAARTARLTASLDYQMHLLVNPVFVPLVVDTLCYTSHPFDKPSANIKFIAQTDKTGKKKDDDKRMTQDSNTKGKDPVKDGCIRTGNKEPVIRDTAGDVKDDAKEQKEKKEKEQQNK